jgi:hypothetical protein
MTMPLSGGAPKQIASAPTQAVAVNSTSAFFIAGSGQLLSVAR